MRRHRSRRDESRWWRLLAVVTAMVMLSTVSALGSSSAEPVAGPTLEVTPAKDLASGTVVTVKGSGFRAHQWLYLFETIELPAVGFPVLHAGKKQVRADTKGEFTSRLTTRLSFAGVDCTSTRCYITTLAALPDGAVDRSQDAATRITFRGSGQDSPRDDAKGPKITVTPNTGLRQGMIMTVTGSGFVPHSRLELAQTDVESPSGRPAAHAEPVAAVVDREGEFRAEVKARPIFGDVNCVQTRCYLAAYGTSPPPADTANHASAPLSFDSSDLTNLAVDEDRILQAGTARISIAGAQPLDRYLIEMVGPGALTAQPHITADNDGEATLLVMTDFDQAIGPYTARLINERTGAVTEIGFSVGTNALFQPDEDTGVVTPMPRPEPAIANPPELPPGPKIGNFWNSWWLIPVGVLALAAIGIIGWYSRDEHDAEQHTDRTVSER